MKGQPKNWMPTGNPTVDALRKVRLQLRVTADMYAVNIENAIREAAKLYDMDPNNPMVTIHNPVTPQENMIARQQKLLEELFTEFRAFVREHSIYTESTAPSSVYKPTPTDAIQSDKQNSFTASANPFTLPSTRKAPHVPTKQDFTPSDYLWIIFAGHLIDPSTKAKVESMTEEQESMLFLWRLIVAGGCFIVTLLVLFFMLCLSIL